MQVRRNGTLTGRVCTTTRSKEADIWQSHLVQVPMNAETCTGTNTWLMTPLIRLGTVWR